MRIYRELRRIKLHPLIEEALKLATYGMGTVFVFLTLLILAMHFMSWILLKFQIPHEKEKSPAITNKTKAAIVAAIQQHRKIEKGSTPCQKTRKTFKL